MTSPLSAWSQPHISPTLYLVGKACTTVALAIFPFPGVVARSGVFPLFWCPFRGVSFLRGWVARSGNFPLALGSLGNIWAETLLMV